MGEWVNMWLMDKPHEYWINALLQLEKYFLFWQKPSGDRDSLLSGLMISGFKNCSHGVLSF